MGKIVSVYEHFGLRTTFRERIKFVNRGLIVLVVRVQFQACLCSTLRAAKSLPPPPRTAKRRLRQIASRATYVHVRHEQVPWNLFKGEVYKSETDTTTRSVEMWV